MYTTGSTVAMLCSGNMLLPLHYLLCIFTADEDHSSVIDTFGSIFFYILASVVQSEY